MIYNHNTIPEHDVLINNKHLFFTFALSLFTKHCNPLVEPVSVFSVILCPQEDCSV